MVLYSRDNKIFYAKYHIEYTCPQRYVLFNSLNKTILTKKVVIKHSFCV